MPVFVECQNGVLVNLAHAVRIVPRLAKKGDETGHAPGHVLRWTIHLAGGEEYEAHGWAISSKSLVGEVVPASAGEKAVVISIDDSKIGRPTESDLMARELPIVAWRVAADAFNSADPIFPESPARGDRILVVMPDGRLLEPQVAEHESIQAASEAILRDAQGDWERRRENTAARNGK